MVMSKTAVSDYFNRDLNSYNWLKRAEESEVAAEVSELVNGSGFKFKTTPYLHQLVSFFIGVCEEQFLYFLDTGTGKTKLVLDLATFFKAEGKVSSVLVFAPTDEAVYGWQEEIATHSDLTGVAAVGSSNEKWLAMTSGADVVVISYPGFVAAVCNRAEVKKGSRKKKMVPDKKLLADAAGLFSMVVFDEVHRCKNPQSLTFRVADYLSGRIHYRFGATGTPVGRDPMDFWAQFHLIDRGETLGDTIGMYRTAFFRGRPGYWGGMEWEFNQRFKHRLHRIIQNKSIRYESSECIDMPEQVVVTVPVMLTDEAKQFYRPATEQMKAAALARASQERVTDLKSSFSLLREICSGFIMWREEESEGQKGARQTVRLSENPKIRALVELVEDLPQESKVVIFHEFVESGRIIGEALRTAKIDCVEVRSETKKGNRDSISRFKTDPNCRALVINTQSGSESLNLQMANYMVFYESPVSPITRKQCMARIHRAGQTRRTFFYDLVTKGTVEQRILEFLKEGKDLFEAIVNGKGKL